MRNISSREFNQDVSKAKRAANEGHVFITDRGKPRHVLLSIDDYYKLLGTTQNVADLLSMPESAEIKFDPVPLEDSGLRKVDF